MKIEIGKRLKQLRVEKGLTQKELAAMVKEGLDYTYVGKIERGEQLPSLKILLKISEALEVPVKLFFEDEKTVNAGAGLKRHLREEKRRELLRALELVEENDIPLLIGIIKTLNRHRNSANRQSDISGKRMPIAAEPDTPYGEE